MIYSNYAFLLFCSPIFEFKKSDELILAKEHFAEIGDDLDFSFVELIDGIDPVYSYRRPKPPTPPPRPETPAEERAAKKQAAAIAAGVPLEAAVAAGELGGAPAEGGGEGGLAAPVVAKEASPFDLQKHFPPDAAEVPFVKSFEPPKAKTPTPPPPAPEEPVAEAPAEEAAPPAEEAAPEPAAAEEPAAEAPPAE